MAINSSKFEIAYKELTAQARKVYDSVPKAESWDASQIIQELHRKGQSMSDMHVVRGCLNSLIACGLVLESSRGAFTRVEVKEKKSTALPDTTTQKPKESEHMAIQNSNASDAKNGPIDRLSGISQRLRILATEIDDAAIALAEQTEKGDAETEKLRQLQAILKSLG